MAELHRGHVGVGVVQPDEGGGGAGLGVLDNLPVVLGSRDVRLLAGEEDGDKLVVLVGILKDLVGAGGDDKIPIESGEGWWSRMRMWKILTVRRGP